MALTSPTSGVNVAIDTAEAASMKLREKLKTMRKLPFLSPSEDQEDGVHNVLVRLLTQAKDEKVSLNQLLDVDGPDHVARAVEAERSRVRRRVPTLAKMMSEEMAQVLPAERVLSQLECTELLEQVTESAGLSPRETQFLSLCAELGHKDYDLISDILGVEKEAVYRIANKVKGKLEAVFNAVESLMENYEHPVQPSPGDGGTWRQFSPRIL
jgi:hypothetical protein